MECNKGPYRPKHLWCYVNDSVPEINRNEILKLEWTITMMSMIGSELRLRARKHVLLISFVRHTSGGGGSAAPAERIRVHEI